MGIRLTVGEQRSHRSGGLCLRRYRIPADGHASAGMAAVAELQHVGQYCWFRKGGCDRRRNPCTVLRPFALSYPVMNRFESVAEKFPDPGHLHHPHLLLRPTPALSQRL